MSQLLYEYLVVLHLNLDSDENVRRVLKYSLKFIEKGLAVHTAFVHVTRYSVDRGFCQIAHRAQTPEYCSHTSKSSGVKFDSGALSLKYTNLVKPLVGPTRSFQTDHPGFSPTESLKMRSFLNFAAVLLLLPFSDALKFDLVAQAGHSSKNERCVRNFVNRDTLVVITAIVSGNRGDGQMVNMHVCRDI